MSEPRNLATTPFDTTRVLPFPPERGNCHCGGVWRSFRPSVRPSSSDSPLFCGNGERRSESDAKRVSDFAERFFGPKRRRKGRRWPRRQTWRTGERPRLNYCITSFPLPIRSDYLCNGFCSILLIVKHIYALLYSVLFSTLYFLLKRASVRGIRVVAI